MCKLLKIIFKAQDFGFDAVATGHAGIAKVLSTQPDLVLLELDLPDMDGKEVVREIRKGLAVPIVVLTSRTQDEEMAVTLDAGADDYVLKPFNPEELLARIRAALRRSLPGGKSVITCHDMAVDLLRCGVTVCGKNVKLTAVEYELVKALVIQQGKVLTYSELLEIARGKMEKGDPHYVRQYIGQVRRKMGDDALHPRYIINQPGVGYRIAYPETSVEMNEISKATLPLVREKTGTLIK